MILRARLKRHHRMTIVFGCILAAIGVWLWIARSTQIIVDFDYARDAQEVHALFRQNWYWLVAATPEQYDVDFILRYRARKHAFDSIGAITLKVLREQNAFKGFVAYYKKNPQTGFILFLSVKDTARRKGYGEQLARHAIKDLSSQGMTTIELVTRPSNERALNLYRNKLGFKEIRRDQDFVYLTLPVEH
mgnify:FL=1